MELPRAGLLGSDAGLDPVAGEEDRDVVGRQQTRIRTADAEQAVVLAIEVGVEQREAFLDEVRRTWRHLPAQGVVGGGGLMHPREPLRRLPAGEQLERGQDMEPRIPAHEGEATAREHRTAEQGRKTAGSPGVGRRTLLEGGYRW